jgi:hypothetical protein
MSSWGEVIVIGSWYLVNIILTVTGGMYLPLRFDAVDTDEGLLLSRPEHRLHGVSHFRWPRIESLADLRYTATTPLDSPTPTSL